MRFAPSCCVALVLCLVSTCAVSAAPDTNCDPWFLPGMSALASEQSDASNGVTLHDNYFFFDSNSSIVVDVAVNGYSISDGQPYEGVQAFGKNYLDVKAGRHKTGGPAAYFLQDITPLSIIASTKVLDPSPGELNFAINVNASFTQPGSTTIYYCDNFRIGQGSYLTTNNWWIGAPECTLDGVKDLKCLCKTKEPGKSNSLPVSISFHAEEESCRIYMLLPEP